MLFCVTTRGRDRIFSKPRDSASVRIVSMRTLLLALMKLRPLVGLVTGRFENRGMICPVEDPPAVMYVGLKPLVNSGEFAAAPPTAVCPLPHPKPNCVPRSRAKLRV